MLEAWHPPRTTETEQLASSRWRASQLDLFTREQVSLTGGGDGGLLHEVEEGPEGVLPARGGAGSSKP